MCPQPDSTKEPSFWLPLPQGKVAVYAYGQGDKSLIALHGFDYRAEVFVQWSEVFAEDYTIYAPDLPFHGLTEWQEGDLQPAAVEAIILGIVEQTQSTSFSLLGHSFGARLILCTMPKIEQLPEVVVLLAPAGIGSYDNVPPLWMQNIAEASLIWPGWLRFFVKLGAHLGLVSKFHQRYAEVQLYPLAQRYRLFRVFNSLKYFSTSTAEIKNFWQKTNLACWVVVASQDRFVSSEKIKQFFLPMTKVKVLEVIGSHHLVNERVALEVKRAMAVSN